MGVLKTYYVTCEVNGDREVTRWQAEDAAHALEQFLDDPALSEGATAVSVRRGAVSPSEVDESVIANAVKVLCDATDNVVILMSHPDKTNPVYLVATDGWSDTESPTGVEYQVSNGPQGERSLSHDYYTLGEAVVEFRRVVATGW
jgi:hypothetical protein